MTCATWEDYLFLIEWIRMHHWVELVAQFNPLLQEWLKVGDVLCLHIDSRLPDSLEELLVLLLKLLSSLD